MKTALLCLGAIAPVLLSCSNQEFPGAAPARGPLAHQQASRDTVFKVPICDRVESVCDSGSLLNGRGPYESGSPNTFRESCPDGTFAAHLGDGVQALRVSSPDGMPLAPGMRVRIEATVRPDDHYFEDNRLDLFFASDVATMDWTYIASLEPSGPEEQVLSTEFVLPDDGQIQAVRALFRLWPEEPMDCTWNSVDDVDDLVFTIGPEPVPQRTAEYDNGLRAPACAGFGNSCDSGELLWYGSNTIAESCAGSTWEPAVEWIRVDAPDGGHLRSGGVAHVEVGVRPWGGEEDRLDVFVAADASDPQWVLAASFEPGDDWPGVLSTDLVLPDGPRPAIRAAASLRADAEAAPCPDSLRDVDDLVFDVVTPDAAFFDPYLRVPSCHGPSPRCDSRELLRGRGSVGPEPNAPNTLRGSCGDGEEEGTFHESRSVDSVRVATLDGTELAVGTPVRVEVSLWADGPADLVIFESAYDNPWWRYVTTIPVDGVGPRTVNAFYTPDREAGTHAVRASLRDVGSVNQYEPYYCAQDSRDDTDDLAFQVLAGDPDQAIPSVSFVEPPQGAEISGTVVLAVEASDDTVISRVDFFDPTGARIGTASAPPWSVAWDVGPLRPGGTSFCARAVDGVGHASETCSDAIVKDVDPPAVGIEWPEPGEIVQGTPWLSVQLHAIDDDYVEHVELLADGEVVFEQWYWGMGGSTSFPWDSAAAGDGPHVLRVRAVDHAGNFAQSEPVTVFVDGTPPSFDTSMIPAVLGGVAEIEVGVSNLVGPSQVELFLDGVLLAGLESPPYRVTVDSRAFPDGPHQLFVRALDALHDDFTTVPVTIDNSPPELSVLTPAEGEFVSGVVPVAVAASDLVGLSRIELRDGTELVGTVEIPSDVAVTSHTATLFWDTSAVSPGEHLLEWTAYDLIGNAGSAFFTVFVDQEDPRVTVTAPSGGQLLQGVVSVSAVAADDLGVARIVFLVDGVEIGAVTGSDALSWSTAQVSDGPHVLAARAYDLAGRTAMSPEVGVTIDNAPPTVALRTPGPGMVPWGQVTLTASAGDASGISYVAYYVDGKYLGRGSAVAPYPLSWVTRYLPRRSLHVLTARAYDLAGNSASSAAVSVRIQ